MFSRRAISVFLLLLAAIYSCEGIAIPMVNRTDPPVEEDDFPLHLVLGPEDYDLNATFECTAPGTTTLWRVDNYLMVDRDEFEDPGLSVLDPRQGLSKLVFEDSNEERKGGFPFVFEALESCYFTLCCLAVKNSVNVMIPDETRSCQTVTTCHCTPQMPNITIEGCNGTSPIFGVTRPPNFNGLVGLNYTFTINATTSGNGTTSVKMVLNKKDSYFTETVKECDNNCTIRLKATSCERESEEVLFDFTIDQCDRCIADEPTIICELNCVGNDACNIIFDLEYKVPICAKNYSYCDDNGCRDPTSSEDNRVSVSVTVNVTSLMDYNATFMVCSYDNTCLNTITPLGNATCSCPEEDCEDSDNALPIAIAAVGSSVGGGLLGALLCAVIACCIIKCKGKRGKTHDNMELVKEPRSPN